MSSAQMLHVGMPLNDVVRSVTATPAAAIGWDDRIGSLGVGNEADVTVLSLEPHDAQMEDCQAQCRLVKQVSLWSGCVGHWIPAWECLDLLEVCSQSCLESRTTRSSDEALGISLLNQRQRANLTSLLLAISIRHFRTVKE